MNPCVVVLTGRKKVGKDTMAQLTFEHGFVRLSFSDQLKKICCRLFPFLDHDYPQEVKDTKLFGDLSPRDIWLKMNVITEIDKNILVNSLREEMESTISVVGRDRFIITDLRKPEEYEFVQSMGYPIIKLFDGTDRTKIVEDSLEDFIDHIHPDMTFVNEKDERSKEVFLSMFSELVKTKYGVVL